ncbi:MAG: hypothetical protein K9J06_07760 [Flavobacteriales bacterium]|nr:hypothetical protein [Flavobacteriales bacterium]
MTDLKRISTAVEFLKDEQSFTVGSLTLGQNEDGSIYVNGWTRFNDLRNVTRSTATEELNETKEIYNRMREASSSLNEFSEGKATEFNLVYSDSGKCGIPICSEKNGKLVWLLESLEK